MDQYDVIIIGAGQAGGPLATACGKAGKKTAIIEQKYVGGTCINYGCTPTKTMIASGRVAYLARRAAEYGIEVGEVAVDMTTVRHRKEEIVKSFRGGSERRLENADNVDLLYGEARFTDKNSIVVKDKAGEERTLTAEIIVINSGGRPSVPKIPGLDEVDYLDSTTVMELNEVPRHLAIIGAGYISMEFGQLFRRLGAEVTMIETATRLLPREDEDITICLHDILTEDGITLMLNSKTKQVAKSADGITLTIDENGAERTLEASHLLVAVGRTPNTDKLGLDAAGVEMDERGYIKTNDQLETNVQGIYAVGDVKGGPAFTHVSYDDYRILEANLLKDGKRRVSDRTICYTMYTDPQLGRVGISEEEAKKAGKPFKVASIPMEYVARANETGEMRGLMKAIVDPDSQQILGAAVLGLEGGELMTMLQIAMMGKLPYTALRDAVFAHPTLAESLNNLFATLE